MIARYLRRRRDALARGDRGLAMVEMAIVAPFLALIVAGILEYGTLWRDNLTVTSSSRAAARVVSNLGDSRAVLANVDETGWVETVEMSTDHSAGTFVERHRVKEEHSHDPNVVREEWDEFLEVYVYLVKCAPRRLVFPPPFSCLRAASHDLAGAGKRAGTSACSLAPSVTRT